MQTSPLPHGGREIVPYIFSIFLFSFSFALRGWEKGEIMAHSRYYEGKTSNSRSIAHTSKGEVNLAEVPGHP